MPENIVTPVAAEKVVPAVIVIVADAYTCAPTGPSQAGLFRHITIRPVPVVFEKMLNRTFSRLVGFFQPNSVCQINVQPAIVVVIEEGQSASLSLDDVFLAVYPSPDILDAQPGFFSHIDECDR